MASLLLYSSRTNAGGKVDGPWRAKCQLKKKEPPTRQGRYWKQQQHTISSPMRGHWFALQVNRWVFTHGATQLFYCLRLPCDQTRSASKMNEFHSKSVGFWFLMQLKNYLFSMKFVQYLVIRCLQNTARKGLDAFFSVPISHLKV